MAKKRVTDVPAAAEPAEKTRGDLKPVRLDLPADIHRNLRLVAADEGMSMASFARDALARLLETEVTKRKLGK
jgi:hypothetical protein